MEDNNENSEYQPSGNLDIQQKEQEQFQSRIDMIELRENLDKVKTEIAKVIVGQEKMVEHLLAALLSNGHVLIEGVRELRKQLRQSYWQKLLM